MESIGNALRIILILIEVVIIFNLMIVVHEFGHYLAARWRGLVVDRFGIWFGKPIWKKKINGVDFCLGWIPAGGYVALPQMAAMETIEGKNSADAADLPKVKPIDKIIVALAGPVFSLGLAFVFAFIVMVVGKPVSAGDESTVIGYVLPDGAAAKAVPQDSSVGLGLKAGDKILEVDGHPVGRFTGMSESIRWYVVRSEGDTIPFLVERDGKQLLFQSANEKEARSKWLRPSMREVGIAPAQAPMVQQVKEGSIPDKAGLKQNDVIEAINGTKVLSAMGFYEQVAASGDKPSVLTVKRLGPHGRGNDVVTITLPPIHPVIGEVPAVKNSPAVAAKLQKGDTILAVNGTPVYSPEEVIKITTESNGAPIQLKLLRDGKELDVTVVPLLAQIDGEKQEGYRMGFVFQPEIFWDRVGETALSYPNPWEEVVGGVTTMVNTVSALLSPKSDIKLNQMGGPVQIGNVYYRLLEAPDGWRRALWFSILLNVNLAIMNMLPLPVLDGGHITLSLLEMIRRRPLNARIMEALQTSCALLLIGFMMYVTFFDLGDLNLFRSKKPTYQFLPAGSTEPAP